MSKNVEKKDKLAEVLGSGKKKFLIDCRAFFEGSKKFTAEAMSDRDLDDALEEKFGERFTKLREDFGKKLEEITRTYTDGVMELLKESGEYNFKEPANKLSEILRMLAELTEDAEEDEDEVYHPDYDPTAIETDEDGEEEKGDGDNNDN